MARLAAGVAKRNIARAWGTSHLPRIEDWETDLYWCQGLTKSFIKAEDALGNGKRRGAPGIRVVGTEGREHPFESCLDKQKDYHRPVRVKAF
ncbi:hypothetical protein NDU88_001254 [Pleurodeles waltl]|uniref:Uncharacterized protein n=1 Tax=Pleurodeles waltl TaxID=8319 RepID=A0AAV7WKZ1_PLEWA|nr:hypothetical protein NDU88_001254 [Pleurodeles waltl]